ncbi:MAG: T9SS type A sorting domain-containing protein [Spirosomataceae bacterium]
MSAVRMNIVPTLKDLTNQSITIQIWSNGNGKPKSLLYQKGFKVTYPANRNDFVEFPLDYGVAVRDTFYVGWLQIGQDGVPVGLDRNNQREEQIFINLGQEWVPYTNFKNDPNLTYFQGSLMIRPVIGGKTSVPLTSITPEKEVSWEVFPNPSSGIVRWTPNDIKQVEVYGINGILLRTKPLQSSENFIDLSDFNDGLYLLRLSNNHKTVTKKVIINK